MKLKKCGMLFMVIIICVCTFTACESMEYERANKLMNEGKYQEAFDIYSELGEYEDSLNKAEECEKGINWNKLCDYYSQNSVASELLSISSVNNNQLDLVYKDAGYTATVTLKYDNVNTVVTVSGESDTYSGIVNILDCNYYDKDYFLNTIDSDDIFANLVVMFMFKNLDKELENNGLSISRYDLY